MSRFLVVAALIALPATVAAQADTVGKGEVGGTVHDSVARAPVAGAHVQLVFAATPHLDARSAETDAKGRFLITGVTPGRYVIGFNHEALDSLALLTPMRVVDVRAGERAKADLAVPSAATIVASLCPGVPPSDSAGLLIGMLRDAQSRLPLDTGTVDVLWHEIVLDGARINSSDRSGTSAVGKEGWFALCGIPGGVDVAIFGRRGADSTGIVAVSVPINGLARHDLFIGGTASLRGSVVSDRNQPLANARVGIAGRDRVAITDSAGSFRLRDLPAGSQTLEVRALGYAPDLRPLALAAGVDTVVDIRLTSVKKVLDTIRVVAERVYNRDSNGFLRRKRTGGGYYFDQQTVQRERPFDLSQMLQRVPSLRIMQRGFDRNVMMRSNVGGYCTPSFWLNGMKMPSDLLAELDLFARPDELDGMEVYRSTSTPAQFASFGGCGAIVVWTKPPMRPKKG